MAAGRAAADLHLADYGPGEKMGTEWLAERFTYDRDNGQQGWGDAHWLVYEQAANERLRETLAAMSLVEIAARQRTATRTMPIPVIDEDTAERRIRSGKHRDSEPPPFR